MNNSKRSLLIQALIQRPVVHDEKLEELKLIAKQISQKSDWLWHLLVSSMSTMGNGRGYEKLINNSANYFLVSYNTLLPLDADTRLFNLEKGLSAATVRRYKRKAIWLNSNLEFIENCGGLTTFQNFLLQTKGRESKLRLLQLFDGIGNKYARNIFMDLYHDDFTNSIAIDERLLDVSSVLEIDINLISYEVHEALFREIADEANITPWSLDRLLYSFKKHYIDAMINN